MSSHQRQHGQYAALGKVAVVVQLNDFVGSDGEESLAQVEARVGVRVRDAQPRQAGDPRRFDARNAHHRSIELADIEPVAEAEIVRMEEAPAPAWQYIVAQHLQDALLDIGGEEALR